MHDLQGNLAALIGPKNTFYRYSAFGEEKMSGSTLSPWRFSSKRSDPETKLVYYGKRFYRSDLGRWLTPDPAGFVDGMNLYAFVDNEPLMHLDQYGLWIQKREPGSFRAPQFVRDLEASFDRSVKTPLVNTWNNPGFQGAWQMGIGVSQASAGAALATTPFSPFGIYMLAQGADNFVTGTYAMVTGRHRVTATEQLLQKTGMSPPRNIEAHHVFPQKYKNFFFEKGINIHEPKHLF